MGTPLLSYPRELLRRDREAGVAYLRGIIRASHGSLKEIARRLGYAQPSHAAAVVREAGLTEDMRQVARHCRDRFRPFAARHNEDD